MVFRKHGGVHLIINIIKTVSPENEQVFRSTTGSIIQRTYESEQYPTNNNENTQIISSFGEIYIPIVQSP